MPVKPRIIIENLTTCPHGVVRPEEESAYGGEVLDFSVNSNPFGPPPELDDYLNTVPIDRYPDRDSSIFRAYASAKLHLQPDRVLAGNGSTQLIRLLGPAFLDAGDRVIIVRPTFGEYEIAAKIAGAEIIDYTLTANDGFRLNVQDLANFVPELEPKIIFLCNPNNPTGTYVAPEQIKILLEACPETLVVVDEAYIAFVPAGRSSAELLDYDNLLILRSMTKDFALAGLRIGYAAGSNTVIEAMSKVQPTWSVNSLAQAAGIYCLSQDDYLNECLEKLGDAKIHLTGSLVQMGFRVMPSSANFLLVETGNGAQFRAKLLREGFCVRDCASFGLPNYVRIAVRTKEECDRLLEAIEIIAGKKAVDAKHSDCHVHGHNCHGHEGSTE